MNSNLIASYEVTSGFGLVISIIVLSILLIAWIVSLFLVIVDSISVFAKIVWLLVLTLLAPVAIPLYLILRHRRRSHG